MDRATIAGLFAAAEAFYYAWADETGLSYDDDPLLDAHWAVVERARRQLADDA